MKPISYYLFFCFLFFSILTSAQLSFFRNTSVIVLNTNGDTLKNPWAGGFNSVQFSEIDLNLDGINDLITFDRTGDRLSTFINSGEVNKVAYTYAPQYIQYFPKMVKWVLLRDFNCDGKMDIFTYYNGGVRIYKNTSTTTLSFSLEKNQLLSNYQPDSTPNLINLYISSADIPAIDDIDNDGDLDILSFSAAGSYLEYHKNLTLETYGICDSLLFELRNHCWGFFKESASNNSVILYDTCSFNNTFPEKETEHSGSTLLSLDVDANNSKDLVLGDMSFQNLTLLYNSDSSSNFNASFITSQDTIFPANNLSALPVNLNIFPAGYYLDVNNDSIKDLICSTNCYFGCSTKENVWYYQNTNANNFPEFNYISSSFLQDGMIEVGEGAHPTFFDYNADGLMDIIVGNYGIHNTSVPLNYVSSLWLYQNVGTAINPSFQLVSSDYAGISAINLDIANAQPTLRLIPTFGDIDGDGDKDMIIGDYQGYLHYFENTSGAGNPANFILNQVQYFGIDVGNFAAPQLIDLNKDLLLDLVIGYREGYFKYYKNIGTLNIPNFTLITDSLGHVNTKRWYEFNGNSIPFVYDDGGSYKMLAGASNGYIYQFNNIDGNLTGTFSMDSSFQNIWEGAYSAVNLADINSDGNLDLLIGNYSGGVAYYQGDFSTYLPQPSFPNQNEIKIYPNPVHELIYIDFGDIIINNSSIEVIDLIGKTIYFEKITTNFMSLNVKNLKQGIYILKINTKKGSYLHKMVKN
ncbi:MAG: hypothetical protein CO118_03025 [Flavobacteriales bacterium CG_4_9_14_3_um_filter_32_8]|nr:MAG: hypothetical protein CO118_03025 [Flavobacteriales bacterium CG_4_9_14_3_um_filter_32_8]